MAGAAKKEKMDRRTKQRWRAEPQHHEPIANQASGLEALARATAPMEYRPSGDMQERRDEPPFHWAPSQHAYMQGMVQQENEQAWAPQRPQHEEYYRDATQGTSTRL